MGLKVIYVLQTDTIGRQKMLYASTKATFKKQFGAGQIKEDYYANHREEVGVTVEPSSGYLGISRLLLTDGPI